MRRSYYKLQIFFVIFGIASICFLLYLASRNDPNLSKKSMEINSEYRSSKTKASNKIYVNVTVFYETFCPACKSFITKQLYPTYKDLGRNYVKLDLVPFGWATVTQIHSDVYNISCQHGEKECYGNRLHACALSLYHLDASLTFINCTLSHTDPVADNVIKKCTEIANISAGNLHKCQLTIGNSLLVRNGRKSNFQHKYMPAVTFNGRFDESIQSQVWDNFSSLVRRYLAPNTDRKIK